jgi:hypothetical protein
MTALWLIILTAIVLFIVFFLWYGGNGSPMSAQEKEQWLLKCHTLYTGTEHAHLIPDAQRLLDSDDGKEFIMHNCVRYRPKALYPEGSGYGPDPRAADMRYGRIIFPRLLRYASHPVFVGRRMGGFIDHEGTPEWHYVAMVRYRSRRDFFKSFIRENDNAVIHKWAAVGQTHVFPVQSVISFIWVRCAVAVVLAVCADVAIRLFA